MRRIQTASKALRQFALRLPGSAILVGLIGDLDREIAQEVKRQQKREEELQGIFKSLPFYMGGTVTEQLEKLLKQIEDTASNSDQSVILGALLFQLRSGLTGASGSIGGSVSVIAQKAVDYGKGGYTDANDPRYQNARRHSAEGQAVDACWLIVHADPAKQYQCKHVRVLGEVEGGGKHVAWVHQPNYETVILATGYNGDANSFDQRIEHAAGQELVINSKFNPPDLGGLAVFLQRDGQIVSDVIGSIGLPGGSHICIEAVFAER